MLKLSRTAIRELKKMYRAVLLGIFVTSVFMFNEANATANAITNLGDFNSTTGYTSPTTTPVLTSSDITTGSSNGSIRVNGTDVSVKGLGSAAYTNSSAYDSAGAADAVATSLTDHTIDANFQSISTQLDDGPEGVEMYGEAQLGDTTINGNLSAGETTVNSLYSNERITVGPDNNFTVDGDGNIETSGNFTAKGDVILGDNSQTGSDTVTVNAQLKVGKWEDASHNERYRLSVTGTDADHNTLVKIDTEKGLDVARGNLRVGENGTSYNFDVDSAGNVTNAGTLTSSGLITANGGVTIDSGKSLQLGGISGNTVNAIDNGTTAQTSDGTTTMATVATVLKSAENATYTGTKTNVTASTVKGAIQDLDRKIGTVTTSTNGVTNNQTVGKNIDALNNKMGNVAELGTYEDKKGNLNKNGAPTTVVKGLENLDQSIGDRTLQSSNGAINTGMATSLSDGLVAAGNQIGSLNYTSTRYVKQGMDLTDAVSSLDRNMNRIDEKVQKMDKQMKSGFASMAAIAGLKPNARACNDTQIAIGGGYYRGQAGVALGGFHYVNDNLMLNLGAGYAGNQSATVSGGLTFGW